MSRAKAIHTAEGKIRSMKKLLQRADLDEVGEHGVQLALAEWEAIYAKLRGKA